MVESVDACWRAASGLEAKTASRVSRTESVDSRWRSIVQSQQGSQIGELVVGTNRSGRGGSTSARGSRVHGLVCTSTDVQSSISSIGRACLPGYGTSATVVRAAGCRPEPSGVSPQRSYKGAVHEPTQSAAPELMTPAALNACNPAGLPTQRPVLLRRDQQATLSDRAVLLADTIHKKNVEQKRGAEAAASSLWQQGNKRPQCPLGIPGPYQIERPRVLLEQNLQDMTEDQHQLQVAQQVAFPKTQCQADSVGPLLVSGAAGRTISGIRGGHGTGRLAMRQKPAPYFSNFGLVYRNSLGIHPFNAEPFSSGDWKL